MFEMTLSESTIGKHIYESYQDIIVVTDKTHTICSINSVGESVFGKNKIGQHFDELLCVSVEQINTNEIICTNKKGDSFPAIITLIPIKDDGFEGNICIIRDISERHKYRSLSRQLVLETQLTKSSRERFIAMVTHELRTPLNAILGFSDILVGQYFGELNEKYLKYSKHIHDSGQLLLSIIDDILDVTNLEAGKVETIPVTMNVYEELLKIVKLNTSMAMVKNVNIHMEETPITYYGDPQVFKQIIHNIITNAVKFNKKDGDVFITYGKNDHDVWISIKDNGIGMDTNTIAHLGELFYQKENGNDRQNDGIGMGWCISKKLMETNGYVYTIDSAVGIGTTITITFPERG